MLKEKFLSKNPIEHLDWLRADESSFDISSSTTYRSWTQDAYLFVPESKLNEIIDEKVSQKINEILEQKMSTVFQEITKAQAKKEISAFIKQRQQEGVFRVSVLDIVLGLKLPSEQVEAVMEGYEKQGKIKEV